MDLCQKSKKARKKYLNSGNLHIPNAASVPLKSTNLRSKRTYIDDKSVLDSNPSDSNMVENKPSGYTAALNSQKTSKCQKLDLPNTVIHSAPAVAAAAAATRTAHIRSKTNTIDDIFDLDNDPIGSNMLVNNPSGVIHTRETNKSSSTCRKLDLGNPGPAAAADENKDSTEKNVRKWIIIDDNFNLDAYASDCDISDSSGSTYRPSDSESDSDMDKPSTSSNAINKGKIISDRVPQTLASTPVRNDDVNNTLELSRTINPVTNCKLNTSVTPEKPKYTKKSRVKPEIRENWKNVSRKDKRNRGEAYEYDVKGTKVKKTAAARKIGPPCPCKKNCYNIVGQEAIKEIFKDFWEIGDYNLQNAYLQNIMAKEDIKRRRPNKSGVTRSGSFKYFVNYKNVKYNVCRVAFLNIHGIKKDRANSAFNKKSDSGAPKKDGRGKNDNPRRFKGPKLDCVHEHIQSLPVRSSHYTRHKNENRQYLDIDDNQTFISKLYNLYRDWMFEKYKDVELVKYDYYAKVFSKNYNIASLPPKKDLCNECFAKDMNLKEYKGQQDKIDQIKLNHQPHVDKVKRVQNLVNACKPPKKGKEVINPDFLAIVMDLQQTQPCPKLHNGQAYYKRKLNVHNFCIFNLQNSTGYMYVWTENTAKRGSVEIYSCLNKYLNDYIYNQSVYPKTLKIFADNCGGQNKNNNICLALLRDVHQEKFDRIELCYLVPGHSYNACDREFGFIEKDYKTRAQILTPGRYIDAIEHCRTAFKTIVYQMQREDFLNIEIFATKNIETRWAHIRQQENKAFQKACQIIISKDVRYGYILKSDYGISDEEGVIAEVHLPKQKKENFDLSKVILTPKYETEIKINDLKINDLKYLAEFTSGEHKKWWEDFFSRQEKLVNSEENEADSEVPKEMDTDDNNPEVSDFMDRIWERDEKVKRVTKKKN